jgi:hypothetical protein
MANLKASGSGPAVSPVLQAYLDQKNALQNAQGQVKQNNLITGLGAGLAQITHGLSMAPGQANLAGIDEVAKGNNAPVTNLMQQQMGGQEALKNQIQLDRYDPASQVSQAAQKLNTAFLPADAKDKLGDLSQYSAAELDDVQKGLNTYQQNELKKNIAQWKLQAAQAGTQNKQSNQADQKELQNYNQTQAQLESMRGKIFMPPRKPTTCLRYSLPTGILIT